jgi:hypothetical protein
MSTLKDLLRIYRFTERQLEADNAVFARGMQPPLLPSVSFQFDGDLVCAAFIASEEQREAMLCAELYDSSAHRSRAPLIVTHVFVCLFVCLWQVSCLQTAHSRERVDGRLLAVCAALLFSFLLNPFLSLTLVWCGVPHNLQKSVLCAAVASGQTARLPLRRRTLSGARGAREQRMCTAVRPPTSSVSSVTNACVCVLMCGGTAVEAFDELRFAVLAECGSGECGAVCAAVRRAARHHSAVGGRARGPEEAARQLSGAGRGSGGGGRCGWR